jgi:AcrR family transcriptional regulator
MPRAGLSRAALVSTAIEMIDDGRPATVSELTLAGLASRVGVAVPSLYKHVASLADLRREVAIASVNELRGIIAAATVGLAGAEAVAAMAQAVRSFAHEHPGRYAATQAAGDPGNPSDDRLTEAGVQTVAVIASILQGFDLPESRTVDAIRILRSAVHGFVLLELEGGFGLSDDRGRSFDLLVKTVTAGIIQLCGGSAGHLNRSA